MNINIINLLFIFTLKINSITMMQFYFDPSNTIDNNKRKEGYALICNKDHIKIYRAPSPSLNLIVINDLYNTIDFFGKNSINFTITKNSFTNNFFSFEFVGNTANISKFDVFLEILTLQFYTKQMIINKTRKIIDFMFKERELSELKKDDMNLYTENLFNMCNEIHEELLLLNFFSTSKFTNKYFQSVIDNFKVLIKNCINWFIKLSIIYIIIIFIFSFISSPF